MVVGGTADVTAELRFTFLEACEMLIDICICDMKNVKLSCIAKLLKLGLRALKVLK